jgi:hypothetical protein
MGRPRPWQADEFDEHMGQIFLRLGFTVMAVCVTTWFGLVINNSGASLLVGAYLMLRQSLEGTGAAVILMNYGFGFSCICLAAAPPSRLRRVGFWMFAGWALFALPLGLRGEVMFPACTAIIVASKRQVPLSGMRASVFAVSLLLFALSSIAFIRSYRQAGLAGIGETELRFNPLDALAEMGGSIRPVSLVVRWRADGDDFIYGASYWAPFDRALGRIVPGWETERLEATSDERLMNVLMKKRVSGLGFSPVAEAFRNFGPLGVPMIMGLIGVILGLLDRARPSRVQMVASGLLFFPLLYSVRNAFVQLPAQVILGFLLLGLLIFFGRTTWRRAKKMRRTGTPAATTEYAALPVPAEQR